MKKTILAIVAMLFFSTAFAQNTPTPVEGKSVVYLFMPKLWDYEATLSLNGKEVCDMRGPYEKRFMDKKDQYYPAWRRLVLQPRHDAIIAMDIAYSVPESAAFRAGEIKHYNFEYVIDQLEEGLCYFLEVKNKGLDAFQIKVITEKEAVKRMNNEKKYKKLEDYVAE